MNTFHNYLQKRLNNIPLENRDAFITKFIFALCPSISSLVLEKEDSSYGLPLIVQDLSLFITKEIRAERSDFSHEDIDRTITKFFQEDDVFVRKLLSLIFTPPSSNAELVINLVKEINLFFPSLEEVGYFETFFFLSLDEEKQKSFALERQVKADDILNKEFYINFICGFLGEEATKRLIAY